MTARSFCAWISCSYRWQCKGACSQAEANRQAGLDHLRPLPCVAAPDHLTGILCNALQQDYSDETSEICSRLERIGGLSALQHSSRHSDVCKCLESLLSPVGAAFSALCEGWSTLQHSS